MNEERVWYKPFKDEPNVYDPICIFGKRLTPGLYQTKIINGERRIKFIKHTANVSDFFIHLEWTKQLDTYISKFWKSSKQYKTLGVSHKRGILLYGPPGCGKTFYVNSQINKVIDMGGIVCNVNFPIEIVEFYDKVRFVQPETSILFVMEDIDKIISNGISAKSEFLNILDGVVKLENVLFICTTNEPEVLEPTIYDRPGRFDIRVEVGYPSEKTRKAYIQHLFSKYNKKTKLSIEEYVSLSNNMSFSHINELFLSVEILGENKESVVNRLSEMKNEITTEHSRKRRSTLGFTNGD